MHAIQRSASTRLIRITIVSLCVAGLACSQASGASESQANAGIDSLNARLISTYRTRDPQAYGALFTDTAVFQWPAFNTVPRPPSPAAMANNNSAGLIEPDL